MGKARILVLADWDADGVVSAAIVKYVQEKLGLFPIKGEAVVDVTPSGPRGLPEILGGAGCADALVVLDIPLTDSVYEALSSYVSRCRGVVYYFDHHESTITHASDLEKLGVKTVVGRGATSVLVRMYVEGFGARLTPRLSQFSDAVAILEGRRKPVKATSEQIVRMAASISKALNVSRDKELWRSYVEWLSSPLPFEAPRLPAGLEGDTPIEAGLRLSRETEEDTKKAAMELAMQAVRAGFIKFVDARGKGKLRGATALAGEISRLTGQPVALLTQREDGAQILVIRGRKGFPQVLADLLLREGVIMDRGGHSNLAVCRVRDGLNVNQLVEALRRLSLEAWRRVESNA